jgi:hypothetical protein
MWKLPPEALTETINAEMALVKRLDPSYRKSAVGGFDLELHHRQATAKAQGTRLVRRLYKVQAISHGKIKVWGVPHK